jgi:hypothetical protein
LHASLEDYRPKQCPACSNRIVWWHSCYSRKADRQNLGVPCLEPLPIPRFFCLSCRTTCSVLPEAIPLHRWHLWRVQQAVLLLLESGKSCYHASSNLGNRPCRQTVQRRWQRLGEEFVHYAFTLRQRSPSKF